MSSSIVMQKLAALAAQCPPPRVIDEADAQKLPIHMDRVGEAGPHVLIIHGGVQGGIGGGPATFVRQKALADRGWQVAIADRPGFGRSESRGVDDMQADAVWIADALGDGAHLIGHSWGGAEALLAAARRPDAVRSLILVEPALQGLAMVDSGPDVESTAKAVMSFNQPLMTSQSPGDYARAFMRSLVEPENADRDRTTGALSDDVATRFGCALLCAKMAPPPVLQHAAEVVAKSGIPVLIVSGGWNESIDAVAKLVARVTGGSHVHVPSTNHFPHLSNPDEFNGVVDAFMRRRESGLASD